VTVELTPEEAVRAAVANTELAGGHIDPRFQREVLLPLAHGAIGPHEAILLALNWCHGAPPAQRNDGTDLR
jgi:hypothetical protein